ncbi:hypothetical protein GQR58_023875 [Nymphon striatum]|nr:hypothetical protein GQR58_023875 [Nymphon striatum]
MADFTPYASNPAMNVMRRKGKDGMSLVSDVMTVLMFAKFQPDQNSTSCELDHQIETMETMMQQALEWKETACNENVRYWSLFLDELYPILRDLTHSIRQSDWHLFVSAVRRCIPLFFGFGRTNYSRWGTLFLEDCLDLQRKFSDIYRCFTGGGWVMYHTPRQGSAVGLDMALEKCYNKPAKVAGGIIGMTRQKEAVALWNLLKHEKDLHVAQLLEWCNLGDKDDRCEDQDNIGDCSLMQCGRQQIRFSKGSSHGKSKIMVFACSHVRVSGLMMMGQIGKCRKEYVCLLAF